jgi:hypothetical protein
MRIYRSFPSGEGGRRRSRRPEGVVFFPVPALFFPQSNSPGKTRSMPTEKYNPSPRFARLAGLEPLVSTR